MEKNIKVSIIIPCYNAENKILRCLNSINNQTYQNIEAIFVNDGSTDNTKEVLNNFKEETPRVIVIHKENGGVSSARNMGIRQSSGEYLMFIDSDDWIENNAVEIMIDKVVESDADVIHYNRYDDYINPNRSVKMPPIFETEKLIIKEDFKKYVYSLFLKRGELGSTCVCLYKKEILQKNKIVFREELLVDEDHVFNMEVFTHANAIFFLPNPLYHYVKYVDGLTTAGIDTMKKWNSRKRHMEILWEYMRRWGYNGEEALYLFYERYCVAIILTVTQILSNKEMHRYKIFKKLLQEDICNDVIRKSKGKNLYFHKNVTWWLIKMKSYNLAYAYAMVSHKVVKLLRPFLGDKIRLKI